MLDTAYRVEIPGGIHLEAQVVGPIPRILAFTIDLVIRGIILAVLSIASIPLGMGGVGGVGGGFFLIILFVIEWLYPVLFELLARGQTPGKKLLGIAVVNDDLSPVTLGTSLIRNLLRTIDFLPMFYLAGIVTMLSNRRFQRLGDLAAGTLVISISKSAQAAIVKDVLPRAPATRLAAPALGDVGAIGIEQTDVHARDDSAGSAKSGIARIVEGGAAQRSGFVRTVELEHGGAGTPFELGCAFVGHGFAAGIQHPKAREVGARQRRAVQHHDELGRDEREPTDAMSLDARNQVFR